MGDNAASHAWIDIWDERAGWSALDPTHGREQTEAYVRVAVGRDYADVPPTRGVYTGLAARDAVGARRPPGAANRKTAAMARYATTISSTLSQAEAFAYMADFSNARHWDPSVSRAERGGDGPVGLGSTFELVARFAGRDVELTYTIVTYEPSERVVLEARRGFVSRDTITVEAAGAGSLVHYEAVLAFSGVGRLADPLMQLVFNRVGAKAKAGLERELSGTYGV